MNISQTLILGLIVVALAGTLALALVQSLTVFAQLVSELSPIIASSAMNTP